MLLQATVTCLPVKGYFKQHPRQIIDPDDRVPALTVAVHS
jgi:hypothetical protein